MANSQIHKKQPFALAEHLFTPQRSLAKKFEESKYPQVTLIFGRTYLPKDDFASLVESLNLDEYEYIVHDKDVNDDGTPKESHIHFLLYKERTFRLTKFLKVSQNTMIEIPRNKVDAEKYLCHENAPKKHQYSRKELVEFHKDGVNRLSMTRQEERDEINKLFLDDLANLGMRELAEKYGRDYMLNYQRYQAFRCHVAEEDMRKEVDEMTASVDVTECKVIEADDGTPIELQLADYVALSFSRAIHDDYCCGLPSSIEIVKLYHKILSEWREYINRPWNISHYSDNVKLDASEIHYGKSAEEIERALLEARCKHIQTTGVYSEHCQLVLEGVSQ